MTNARIFVRWETSPSWVGLRIITEDHSAQVLVTNTSRGPLRKWKRPGQPMGGLTMPYYITDPNRLLDQVPGLYEPYREIDPSGCLDVHKFVSECFC